MNLDIAEPHQPITGLAIHMTRGCIMSEVVLLGQSGLVASFEALEGIAVSHIPV